LYEAGLAARCRRSVNFKNELLYSPDRALPLLRAVSGLTKQTINV
jgi:hypothetical protein